MAKAFFENGAAAFDKAKKGARDQKTRRIENLEKKLQTKNEVLSELMEEHVKLKKILGSSERGVGIPRYRNRNG